MATCPICAKTVKGRVENPAFPFCSSRCKAVDLGKWLNEEYRIPVTEAPDDDELPGSGAEASPVSPRDMRN